MAGGLPDARMLRVQGLAASSLFERDDPLSPSNRRISIIVMNRDAEDRVLRTFAEAPDVPVPGSAVPDPKDSTKNLPVAAGPPSTPVVVSR